MKERYETFTVLIDRIGRNIRKIKNREMAEYHLRSAHISCLYYLSAAEGITAAELCERCEEDKATVSRCLDYLEKNGFIADRSHEEKRYKNQIFLTEKGREAGRRITHKIDAVLEETSRHLTEEERTAFYRSLSIISDSLDAVAKTNIE